MKKFTLSSFVPSHLRAFALSCLLLFSLLLSPFSLNAQIQLPDGGFETGWKTKTSAHYGGYLDYETDFFYTLNSLLNEWNGGKKADLTAFRDDVIFKDGKYSIRLRSGQVAVGESYVFLPGMVGTIDQDFVSQFLNEGEEVNVTRDWAGYTTPQALEGWYRYRPAPGDSALIDIGFYDFIGSELVEVFVEKLIIKQTVNNWTHFRIIIPEQYRNRYFSAIRVLFVSSAGVNFEKLDECKGQVGSELRIDDISLNYDLGINQPLFSTLKAKAFPNPATEVLNLEMNEHFSGKIVIYNTLGSLVMEENITGVACSLNTAALAAGNYIYQLIEGNTIFAQGKFVVVK